MLTRLPSAFPATRDALHAVAEHVVAAARYRVDGHIGLRPTPGGFGTSELGNGEAVRVEGNDIVHERAGEERRAPLTTLRAAAEFVGAPLGAPANVYTPATALDPDAALAVDAPAARALADWYAFAYMRLAEVCGLHPDAAPSSRQLWPEHFDLATDLGDEGAGTRATYGASPGDDVIAEPYLYVSPWDPARKTGPFGEQSFGAALAYSALVAAPEPERAALAFFDSAARLVLAASG
jgi:hypothetical protein